VTFDTLKCYVKICCWDVVTADSLQKLLQIEIDCIVVFSVVDVQDAHARW
jgi:hypothetical protein